MSGKPALIRQSDVTRIVKGYAAAGISVGITVEGTKVHFEPVDDTKNDVEPSALEQWKANRYGLRANGRA